MKKTFLLFFLLIPFLPSSAQERIYENSSRIRTLSTANEQKDGQIYMTQQSKDSSDQLVLYLINRTEDTLLYYGEHGNLSFTTEAQLENGEWKRAYYRMVCATGYGYSYLPPNSYTWTTVFQQACDSSHLRLLRYTAFLKDTLIYSEPIVACFDSLRFLSYEEQNLSSIESYLEKDDLDESTRKNFLLRKIRLLIKLKRFQEAIRNCEVVLTDYPLLSSTHYLYALSMNVWMAQTKDLSVYEKYAVISEMINRCKKVTKESREFEKALQKIQAYQGHLPTREDWAKQEGLDCTVSDGKVDCFLERGMDVEIRIRFRDRIRE